MFSFDKDYTIGKGRLFFDQFAPGTKTGTGEMFFGNAPEVTTNADAETLDHYDSTEGLNVKDESITTENNLGGSFTVDSINADNLALWFAGAVRNAMVTASAGESESIAVLRGRFYQLGGSLELPTGARNVKNVTISTSVPAADPANPAVVTAIALPGNVEVDLESGRLYVEIDAPDIKDGATLTVTYDIEASTRKIIIGKGQEIRGALRFISANPVGKQKDYFWPYVKITSNGDYSLIGDEWMTMSFNYEVLKRDTATDRVYVDVRN